MEKNQKQLILTIVITFVATTLVVGGLVYLWQSSLVDEKQQSFEEQKQLLINQMQEEDTQIVEQQDASAPSVSTATAPTVDTQEVEDSLKGASLSDYLDAMSDYRILFPPAVSIDSAELEKFKVYVAEGIVEPCRATNDGPCGFDLYFVPKSTVKNIDDLEDEVDFYLAVPGGAGISYYGPFTDDLKSLINEAKGIK